MSQTDLIELPADLSALPVAEQARLADALLANARSNAMAEVVAAVREVAPDATRARLDHGTLQTSLHAPDNVGYVAWVEYLGMDAALAALQTLSETLDGRTVQLAIEHAVAGHFGEYDGVEIDLSDPAAPKVKPGTVYYD